MVRIPVSQARAALPTLLTRVRAGEEITITRNGEAVAVLVGPDALRVRRVDGNRGVAAEIRDALADARDRPLHVGALSAERAEALIAEVDAGRAAR